MAKNLGHSTYGHLTQTTQKVLNIVENTKHGKVKLVFYCSSYFAG